MKIRQLLQFKKQLHSVHLSSEQKETVKNNLVAFMQENPVRKKDDDRLIQQKPAERLFLFFTQKHMYASIATILILLTGTGTAFAAENTVPGDTLYPVKVHVNEPVRSALAVSSEAQAKWDTEVAQRRLDEAAKLASEGKLSAETEAKIEAHVEAQTEKVKERLAKLDQAGDGEIAAQISTHLENVLTLHSELLSKLESDDTTKDDIKPIVKQLKEEAVSLNSLRKDIDSKVETKAEADLKVAAQNRMENAQKHIDDAKKYLDDKDVVATSSAQVKLDLAVKTQAEGKTKFDAGAYKEAFVLFGTAQRLALEAKLMAHVKVELNSDNRLDKIFKDFDERKDEDHRSINLESVIRGKVEDNSTQGDDQNEVKHDERDEDENEPKEENRGPGRGGNLGDLLRGL